MKKRYVKKQNIYKYLFYLILLINLLTLGYILYKDHRIRQYLSEKINDVLGFKGAPEGNFLYGIDVSEYQGVINWSQITDIEKDHEISFVMIRSTAGKDHRDRYFTSNWRKAKNKGIIRAAYHYFRPNEEGIKQAEFFIKNVQ